VLTDKGFSYGGSLIRPEAPGRGAAYYPENVLKHGGGAKYYAKARGIQIPCCNTAPISWSVIMRLPPMAAASKTA